jgi:hypothetical protein
VTQEKLERTQKGYKMDGNGLNGDWLKRPPKQEVQKMAARITAERVLWGALLVGVTAISTHALFSKPTPVLAQTNTHSLPDKSLITHTQVLGDGTQQLCVLDPRRQVVAVYHIDAAKGGIALRSVRNIYWDLRINHFNGTTPLPEEIRSLIDQE